MCPVSLLQQDISIRCLLFCFLFIARNRKTRFPAFSIPNGLVLRKNIPSEPTPRLHRRQEKQKLVHSLPQIGSQGPSQFVGLISCLPGRKERQNYKAAGSMPQNLLCWCEDLRASIFLRRTNQPLVDKGPNQEKAYVKVHGPNT